MDLTHRITLAQVSGGEADAPTAEERAALTDFAQRLSAAQLHRLWQLLLKGHEEVRQAPDPLVSAQMALLRVMHAADMPDPGKLSKKLEELAEKGIAPGNAASAPTAGETGAAPAGDLDWADLVQQIDDAGQLRIAQIMRDWIRVIKLEPGKLVYAVKDGLGEDPAAELRDCLFRVTGSRWQVALGEGEANPTLRELEAATKLEREEQIKQHPLVKATFEAFPDAELLSEQDNIAQAGGSRWSR